jgi:hypothetical protein
MWGCEGVLVSLRWVDGEDCQVLATNAARLCVWLHSD